MSRVRDIGGLMCMGWEFMMNSYCCGSVSLFVVCLCDVDTQSDQKIRHPSIDFVQP